jgi:hypothetical protein
MEGRLHGVDGAGTVRAAPIPERRRSRHVVRAVIQEDGYTQSCRLNLCFWRFEDNR